jgi:hypothetical protein
MGVHLNTLTTVNLGRHPIQARLGTRGLSPDGERYAGMFKIE